MSTLKSKLFALLISLIVGTPSKVLINALPQDTLAPPPIRFAIPGIPYRETIYIEKEDTYYEIYWDGKYLYPPMKVECHQDMNPGMLIFFLVTGTTVWIWGITAIYKAFFK